MYALHVLDTTRQLADFIREGQSQNDSLVVFVFRLPIFAIFAAIFRWLFVVVAVATALFELVLLNRPAC